MLTYSEAEGMMERARNGRRKLENNTWLESRGADHLGLALHATFDTRPYYVVRLHQTDVVTLHPDGSCTLNSGGWRSVTTKDRINRYAPGSVASDKGAWYYYPRRLGVTRYPFADGMTISPDGAVAGAGVDETAIRRELLKQIRAYVDGYAVHVVELGKLEEPGPGDCWGCYMVLAPGEKPKGGKAPWRQDLVTKPGADHVMRVDHILSHFQEKYYVPSLFWRALQRRGDPAFCWNMANALVAQGDARIVWDDLRAYLKKLTPALVVQMARDRGLRDAEARPGPNRPGSA